MARRYQSETAEVVVDAHGAPEVIRWRGRRYEVRDVIAYWVEAMPWWRGDIPAAGAGGQREVWRVDAVGRTGNPGVYELRRDPLVGESGSGFGTWHVVRVLD